ncbi:hypothetical protein X801_08610, partial [Opisthorchis viverrini]
MKQRPYPPADIHAHAHNHETQPHKPNMYTRFCETPVLSFRSEAHADEFLQVTEGLELNELEGQIDLAHILCRKLHTTRHIMQTKQIEDVLHFEEGLTEFAADVYDKIIKLQA